MEAWEEDQEMALVWALAVGGNLLEKEIIICKILNADEDYYYIITAIMPLSIASESCL